MVRPIFHKRGPQKVSPPSAIDCMMHADLGFYTLAIQGGGCIRNIGDSWFYARVLDTERAEKFCWHRIGGDYWIGLIL